MANILIVDDNFDACHFLKRLLGHFGYQADYVCSGEEALYFLMRHRVDLVILDHMMPGMNGVEVVRRVRRRQATHALPIVMFSAVGDEAVRREALEAGANEYWIKGAVDFAEIGQLVGTFIPATAMHS